jgi:RNA polymerase sigma-70 factor, ECF subfamily
MDPIGPPLSYREKETMGVRLNAAVATSSREDWAELIERTAAGDRESFARLFDGTSPYVNGLARRILGDREAAEEVVMEVYVQAWQQSGRYERSRGAPLSWLLNLTRSRAIDRLRARSSRDRECEESLKEEPIDFAETADPAEHALIAERHRRVRDALARLSTDERRALELAYFGGFSHTEIAAALGLPLGTVKTRIRLGLLRLERLLVQRGASR